MFRSVGPLEIGIILIIIFIIFGAGKLPQVGGAIGRSIREFRKASRGEDEDNMDEAKTPLKAKVQSNEKAGKTGR